MATIAQAAAHIFIAPRNFADLIVNGVIAKQSKGAYDLDIVREQYIRHLRNVAAGREKQTGEIDGDYERARKDKELADRTALQNARTRGELVSIDEVVRQVESEYGVVRTRLLAIAGKFGSDLDPAQVARIEAEIREALEELHDPNTIADLTHGADGEHDDDINDDADGAAGDGEAGA